MVQAKGSNTQIVIQEESVFKTDPGAADVQLLYYISESLRSSKNLISSTTLRGNRNPTRPVTGNQDVSGNILMELQAYTGILFKGVLGSVSTAGADPYTHTIKIGSSVPSFLIEKGFTDITQYFKYNGCKINQLSLSVTTEGFVICTFDWLGAKETTGVAPFDATPTDLGKQSFSNCGIGTIEEGGASIAIVTSIDSLTISNQLDGDNYVINPAAPCERHNLPEGYVAVTGTLNAIFEDLTLYNKAKNNTESSLKVIWSKGDGLGSAGNESIEMFIPELIYGQNAPIVEGPQGVMVELPFEGYYDDHADASAFEIVLKNTSATL